MSVHFTSSLYQERSSSRVSDEPLPQVLAYPSGALKVIAGQGMPSFRHHEPGELYVRIAVRFPESIDINTIPLLEQALPKRKEMAKFGKKAHVDEVTLEEPNDRQRKSATNGDEMDEDEEEGGGRQGVQCAQRE